MRRIIRTTMEEKRNIKVTLEQAIEWYNSVINKKADKAISDIAYSNIYR